MTMAYLGVSFFTVILSVLLGYFLIVAIRKYLKFRRNVTLLCKIPGLTPEFLFGNSRQMPDLSEAGLKWMRENCDIRPKVSVGWLGPFLGLVDVVHPETLKVILKSSAPKSRSIYGLVTSWLGEGLLVSNGTKWQRSRRLLTPAFHFDILKRYLDVKNKACDVLVGKLQTYADEGVYFEGFKDICLFSLDVILQCAFSYKCECQTTGSDNPYVKAVSDLNELLADRFFKFWLHNDYIYYMTANGQRWKRACNLVHKVAEHIIDERKEKLVNDTKSGRVTKYRDFLGILLTAQDEEGAGMTSLEIRNEVDTFLFEGHDTTTSGISWALYSIAKYPDIQRKLQDEIDEVLHGRQTDEILCEDLPKLNYLSMVINESLRINPPVPFVQRITNESMMLAGYEIPEGTTINIILYNVLNNSTVWDTPSEFCPDRFLPENVEKRDPFSFVPFSAGSRNCIGQNFAMNEMKTVISRILRRFTLELDPNHIVERQLTAVLKSKNGIYLKAVSRKISL